MGFNDIDIKVNGGSDIISTLQTYTTRILKPNIVDGKNVLTQEMLSSKNTKYVIKYNYELLGATLTMPQNVILEFDGGSIKNGTLVGNDTLMLNTNETESVLDNVTLDGTWKESSYDLVEEVVADKAPGDGMGRIILRKDKTFAEQLTQENTIYVIRYDFELTEDVTIPENCVLEFDGGSLNCIYKLILSDTVLNLNKFSIKLSAPIELHNSKIYGNGGEISANDNFSYPYMIYSDQKGIIENVIIDGRNNITTGVFIYSESSIINHPYQPQLNDVIIKNLSYEDNVNISNISNMVVTTSTNHGLVNNDIIEISNVIGGSCEYVSSEFSIYNDIFLVEVLTPTTIKLHCRALSYSDNYDDGYTSYISGGKITKIGTGVFLGGFSSTQLERKIHINNIFIDNVHTGIVCRTEKDKIKDIHISNVIGNAIDILFGNDSIFDGIVVSSTIKARLSHGLTINNVQASIENKTLFDFVGWNQLYYAGGEVEDLKITNVNAVFSINLTEPIIKLCTRGSKFSNFQITCSAEYLFIKTYGVIYESLIDNINFLTGSCNFIGGDGEITSTFIDRIYSTQEKEGSIPGRNGSMILRINKPTSINESTYTKISNSDFDISLTNDSVSEGTFFENITGELDLANIHYSTIINCICKNNSIQNNNIIYSPYVLEKHSSGSYATSIKKEFTTNANEVNNINLGKCKGSDSFKSLGVKIQGHSINYNYCSSYCINLYISINRENELQVKGDIDKKEVLGTLNFVIYATYGNKSLQIPFDGTTESLSLDNYSSDTILGISFETPTGSGAHYIELTAVCNKSQIELIID